MTAMIYGIRITWIQGKDIQLMLILMKIITGVFRCLLITVLLDSNGDILGACGVGVDMNDLVDILARFEEIQYQSIFS